MSRRLRSWRQSSSEQGADPRADESGWITLGRLALKSIVGLSLFVGLWAGINFVFGTALDGPIGAFLMEPPCQALADTTEPLERYSLGRGRRAAASVCHFA